MVVGKAGTYLSGALLRVQALPANIRLGQVWLIMTNTVAYYTKVLLVIVKRVCGRLLIP
jgi:hypothetical protein